MGRNEKTKIIAKLQKKGKGAPAREPIVSEEEQKHMMAYAYRKQEELKVHMYNMYSLLCTCKVEGVGLYIYLTVLVLV